MRLDVYLAERGFAESRAKAKFLISESAVTLDGAVVKKPSFEIDADAPHEIVVAEVCPYVSVGGMKLEAALERFGVSPSGLVAIDIGSSTGGFTDCLLAHGAVHVYAVDSGTSQLHPKLSADARVTVMENTNARYLTRELIGTACGFAVCDVSFISQRIVLPAVADILDADGVFVTLIKPQFELDKNAVARGKGIVTDAKDRARAIVSVADAASTLGLYLHGLTVSPVAGGGIGDERAKRRGNREYLAYFDRKRSYPFTEKEILEFVKNENSNDTSVRR